MAFEKINYVAGDVLTAEQMNKIQDTVALNEGNIIAHLKNKNNPHGVTAEAIGARPNTWTPTAEEVGAVPTSGGTMSGTLKLNGILLTSGVDYGDALPAAGTVGRIFFKKVSD